MQLSQCPWFCTACTKLWARVVECLFPLARPVARTIAISASRNQQKKKPEPVTGPPVVTRKITRGLARVDAGLDECLTMGNLDSLRDWGHARDTRFVVGPTRSLRPPARSVQNSRRGGARAWPASASRRPRRNDALGLQWPAKTCSSSSLTACRPEWFCLAPQSREAASCSQRAIESTSWLRPVPAHCSLAQHGKPSRHR